MSLPRVEVVVEQIPDGEFQVVCTDLANQELIHFTPRFLDLHKAMEKGLDIVKGIWDDMNAHRVTSET